jgi:hypothetical protein
VIIERRPVRRRALSLRHREEGFEQSALLLIAIGAGAAIEPLF